jgi:hypothetical protein
MPDNRQCATQVCRAACSAVSACADAVGKKFEPIALYVLPELCRTVVGSILVMTEAADACMSSLVGSVHSLPLLHKITDIVSKDKNNKLRMHCTKYLLKVLYEWPQPLYRSLLPQVKEAISKAVGDASAGAHLRERLCMDAHFRVDLSHH